MIFENVIAMNSTSNSAVLCLCVIQDTWIQPIKPKNKNLKTGKSLLSPI